jgi:hypothetical protein
VSLFSIHISGALARKCIFCRCAVTVIPSNAQLGFFAGAAFTCAAQGKAQGYVAIGSDTIATCRIPASVALHFIIHFLTRCKDSYIINSCVGHRRCQKEKSNIV